MHRFRTQTCDDLRKEHIGQPARLSGWVHTIRDHGGVMFIDLRDHYGITQVVANPNDLPDVDLTVLSNESVIKVDGQVVARTEGTANAKLPTGEIELKVSGIEVLSRADTLPLLVNTDEACN